MARNVITAYLTLNNKRFYNSLKTSERQVINFGKRASQIGSNLFVGATLPIALVGAAMLEAGRKAEETDNKFRAVFGNMEKDAARVARALNETTNKSVQDLRAELSGTADLLTGFGVGEKQALDLASGISQLAADLASFNNIDPTQAFTLLQKGVLGRTAALTELGIAIDVAGIKAKALADGIDYEKLSGSTKAAVRAQIVYQLALDQTAKAQGDVVRSAGSFTYEWNPGKADSSIFIYRMESKKPGIMMPEIGRAMVHKEGVELIKEWINALEVE